jgi:hypothetical protein
VRVEGGAMNEKRAKELRKNAKAKSLKVAHKMFVTLHEDESVTYGPIHPDMNLNIHMLSEAIRGVANDFFVAAMEGKASLEKQSRIIQPTNPLVIPRQ